MTTEGLKDWLKQKIDVGQGIRVGSIDGNADQCVGVYPGKISGKQNIALGGKAQTMVQYGATEILVHWSKSAVEAEKKAMDVWRLFWGWTTQLCHWRDNWYCLLYTSPSPRDRQKSRMPSSA